MPTELKKKWGNFLLLSKFTSRNQEVLSEYFFEQALKEPQAFYEFLDFLKSILGDMTHIEAKKRIAQNYLKVISNLCERFNFAKKKDVLDSLCFEIMDPQAYAEISKILETYQNKSEDYIQKIIVLLQDLLKINGYLASVSGRYKNIYSVYNKMQRKGNQNVLTLNDIFAFRIILHNDNEDQCFEIANILHDHFAPVTKFFKDYITIPKINGYKSLHTGIRGIVDDLNIPVEIQIRTDSMHKFAENGFAAHWLYARTKKADVIGDKEKMLIDHLAHGLTRQSQKDYLYLFSRDGDLFKLPMGATVLDFAYRIHSGLGKKAESAVVNGKEVDIYYYLKEGDQVEIKKSQYDKVCKEWLEKVSSDHARKKIIEQL